MLVALRDSPEAPVIEGSSLALALCCRLADLHDRYLIFDDDNKTFTGSTNTYLTNCLLSGLSLEHDLAWSPAQYLEIRNGLVAYNGNSSIAELLVIGPCIQLLTIGSKIVLERMFYPANEVATLLRSQQSAGTVKEANARKLLEVRQLFQRYHKLSSLLSSTAYYLTRRKRIQGRGRC